MGKLITDFSGGPSLVPPGVNAKQEEKKLTPTQFWINVGVVRNGKHVTLPMGIPLDKMPKLRIPPADTENQEFLMLQLARSKQWAQVQAIMEQLEPGQEVELPFSVRLRRVKPNELTEEQVKLENPFDVGTLEVKPV